MNRAGSPGLSTPQRPVISEEDGAKAVMAEVAVQNKRLDRLAGSSRPDRACAETAWECRYGSRTLEPRKAENGLLKYQLLLVVEPNS
jgi:hypothetical protein